MSCRPMDGLVSRGPWHKANRSTIMKNTNSHEWRDPVRGPLSTNIKTLPVNHYVPRSSKSRQQAEDDRSSQESSQNRGGWFQFISKWWHCYFTAKQLQNSDGKWWLHIWSGQHLVPIIFHYTAIANLNNNGERFKSMTKLSCYKRINSNLAHKRSHFVVYCKLLSVQDRFAVHTATDSTG